MQEDVKTREYDKFRPADGDKSKVAVTVEQDAGNPIPTYTVYGTPLQLYGEETSTPDVEVELIAQTVTAESMRVVDVNVSCFIEGKAVLYVNDVPVATSRTAPGKPDAKMVFVPFMPLDQGDVLKLKFKARPNSPAAEVEGYANVCNCSN